jgi:hypothetical protein
VQIPAGRMLFHLAKALKAMWSSVTMLFLVWKPQWTWLSTITSYCYPLSEDNLGAKAIAENGNFKGRSKHFELRVMALSSSLYHPRCCDNQSNQTRSTACLYRYGPASSSSASLYGTCHTWQMLILLPLSVALRLLVVCQLPGINSIWISFDYIQCQYSISFTCSTERGGWEPD